jgi:23S rRNA (guanosine2251-2'-O)-methyltransferase
VLVVGAEGSGLSRLVAEHCDFLVAIPMAGDVGSLNVAQAATVLAYEWFRRGA